MNNKNWWGKTPKNPTPLPRPDVHPPVNDSVNHPKHYVKGGLECIDVIKAAVTDLSGFEGYCIGNIIKYCWRWKSKGGVEDLRKARKYLEFLINSLSDTNDVPMPTKEVSEGFWGGDEREHQGIL